MSIKRNELKITEKIRMELKITEKIRMELKITEKITEKIRMKLKITEDYRKVKKRIEDYRKDQNGIKVIKDYINDKIYIHSVIQKMTLTKLKKFDITTSDSEITLCEY